MSEHLYYSILVRKADELWDELDWSVDVLEAVPFEQARREAQALLTGDGIVETGVGAWWDSGRDCRMGCAPLAKVHPDQVCVGHLLETYEIAAFRPRLVTCASCQSEVSISHRQWSTRATVPCRDCGQPPPVADPVHRPSTADADRHHGADGGLPALEGPVRGCGAGGSSVAGRPRVHGDLWSAGQVAAQRGCRGGDELAWDVAGGDPGDLDGFIGFAVGKVAGLAVAGEDDGEEAVGCFDSTGAVDDVGKPEIGGINVEAGFFLELADRGSGERFAGIVLADRQVPHALSKLGSRPSLEEDDPLGVQVMDDDGGDRAANR